MGELCMYCKDEMCSFLVILLFFLEMQIKNWVPCTQGIKNIIFKGV